VTISYDADCATLHGHVGVDDADGLAKWLRHREHPTIDLGDCEQVHGAVLQVLLALQPAVTVAPRDPQLLGALAHLVTRNAEPSSPEHS
jgi:hypothetical protein